MTMVITVVPPVGPPIPTITGKAIRSSPNSKYEVYLLRGLEKGNRLHTQTHNQSEIFVSFSIMNSILPILLST